MKSYSFIILSFLFVFCSDEVHLTETITINEEITQDQKAFNSYWYDGSAEITSYDLTQFRYGETHKGTAINIFVTEDFLPIKQVKADYRTDKNIPVLKLNSTKKFITGIYPYSLMTSTFTPVNTTDKTIKITYSSQEWCGNTFLQLNNREKFDIEFHSYFENIADKKIALEKNILENEIWNLIRISPEKLPLGKIKMIPSFEYLALNHQEIKSYDAVITKKATENSYIYQISYTNLKRELSISFTKTSPFYIHQWEERITLNGHNYITKAKKIKTMKSKYWTKNQIKDKILRKTLGL